MMQCSERFVDSDLFTTFGSRFVPNIDENIHGAAAYHAFFTGFVSGKREVMQSRFAVAHRLARFSPNFGFDAAAADGPGSLAAFKEEHFRSATLRRRAAR